MTSVAIVLIVAPVLMRGQRNTLLSVCSAFGQAWDGRGVRCRAKQVQRLDDSAPIGRDMSPMEGPEIEV